MRPILHSQPAAYGPVDEGAPRRLSDLRRGFSTAVGACVALALLTGLGLWLYGLGVREPGDVPIIRASVEPAKIRPEDPGGAVAPYQDISSYRVAGSGPARISAALAPPPPEPRREDVAMGELAPAPAERPQAADGAQVDTQAIRAAADGSSQKPAEPAAARDGAADATPETAEAQPVDPVPNASDHAPPASPVAPRRPADLKARMAEAVEEAERSADRLARRAAESAIQLQLAADPEESAVRRMWQRIARANSDILHDRELAVQPTVSGGTTFYRLRVGPFGDVAEARAVCQALKARGQDCVVARNG